ncbi:MAG: hypothetical protein O9345_08090 [Burkholderiaceae bacterium]|jgi:ElaB/YqjD/DUF883 family membrane-anchored ribosome-binding protein|nr:hypothetical protein [Burkholderiales bacterium]MCZ8338099.1 hypothetical protein [Burkholderiaceae bacterium]
MFRTYGIDTEDISMNRRDRIVDDVGAMLTEAQDMLRRAGSETGDAARELRLQVESRLDAVKTSLHAVEDDAMHRARMVTRTTDHYVHEHPWQGMAAAATLGFVAGLLMNRR